MIGLYILANPLYVGGRDWHCYITVDWVIFAWLNFRALSFSIPGIWNSYILNFCKERPLLITIVAEPYKYDPTILL